MRKLATIQCLVLAATSPYTTNTVAGTNEIDAGDATELKWEFDEDLGRYYVSFPDDQ